MKGAYVSLEQLIAEHEKDPHTKALLDEARAILKARIAEAGGLENLIEIEPFVPSWMLRGAHD